MTFWVTARGVFPPPSRLLMHSCRRSIHAALLTVPLLMGCYANRLVTGVPPTGISVEAELSPIGTQELTRAIGPNAARLDGILLSASADSLVLSVREVRLRDGQALFLQGTTITLASSQLTALRSRTFDPRRTVVAAGLGLAAAILIIDQVRFGGGGDGGADGGGTTPALAPRRP